MITWPGYISQLNTILSKLSICNADQKEISIESAFSIWKDWTLEVRTKDKYIYFIGNGASASMASHFAADMAKNGGVRTQVFTDLSLITATANDMCYEEVYSQPLRWYMEKGDMLVAISSSGSSPNVLRGTETAKELGGKVITISAMKEENPLKKLGDLNFYVSAQTYGLAEVSHMAILHFWVDQITMEI